VRSSLDNLRLQALPAEARVYIARADEGLRRLATILSRMSEATRLEPGLAATEREPFDLAAVVRGCVEGYRLANPGREILLREPGAPVPVLGAPDLAAQLLDKLVDNALGFARAGTPVRVELARDARTATLSVENQGPPLPAQMQGRLFESMVSIRRRGRGRAPPRTRPLHRAADRGLPRRRGDGPRPGGWRRCRRHGLDAPQRLRPRGRRGPPRRCRRELGLGTPDAGRRLGGGRRGRPGGTGSPLGPRR